MLMVVLIVIASAGLAALIAMSRRASRRFAPESRIPMQWSFGGRVKWTAPRRLALSFTPVLFTVLMVLMIGMGAGADDRLEPDERPVLYAVALFTAALFIAIHALHLYLIRLTLERNGKGGKGE